MDGEAEFNRAASEAFVGEYERETGHGLRFKGLGNPFPDAILETDASVELGVEFVSVVLPFVWQEETYFSRYREQIYEALRPARPRYQSIGIRLQSSSSVVQGPRPSRLPDVNGAEGRRLVEEFRDMLAQHFETIHASYGILIERIATDAPQAFPTLLTYFNAVLIWDVSQDDPRKPHPEDPVIEAPIVVYRSSELIEAVRRALGTKARKGTAYATNLLVLHTLETPGKSYFPGAAMNALEIEKLGRELLTQEQELSKRFDEIWFLNAFWTEGQRLYRLK